jgi:membrane protease YdiL (CAAX protease family)
MMGKKQRTAIVALPVLVIMMIGVYKGAEHVVGAEIAWYTGFFVYWPLWCMLYPVWILGWRRVWSLLQPGKFKIFSWVLLIFPPLMSFIGSILFAQEQHTAERITVYILICLANGIFEEILWRGVYITLFPDNKLWGLVWPTVWFALWHFAPGSISPLTDGLMLMAGAAGFGACCGLLAVETGSILWSMISHTLTRIFWVLR